MFCEMDEREIGRSPPPFIGTRRGGYMHEEYTEVVILPRIRGEQGAAAVVGALESMAPGVDVVL